MYPADWHRTYSDTTGHSARLILPPLLRLFGVRSLVEVGCGHAHWTQAAVDAGVEDYTVVDGPWTELDQLLVAPERFVQADLGEPLELGRTFDLAVCLEVAEHVRDDAAETLVRSLVEAADVIVFGAAVPFQDGFGHINEQWPSWWRDKFDRLGCAAFDLVRLKHWNDRSVHYWYRQNTIVYVNRRNEQAIQAATDAAREMWSPEMIFDAVHPEKFEETASYRNIAPRRLMRQLPRWTAKRIRTRLSG